MDEVREKILQVLKQNQKTVAGNFFTLPSPVRYPYQWLWDSCFHALIYNALDQSDLAEAELLSAAATQHDSGLLPHINFWSDGSSLTPRWGREGSGDSLNRIFTRHQTSELTQPPIIARAVLETYEKSENDGFIETLFPKLEKYFEYLARERTVGDSNLVFIINPDESGEDNSPRFDESLSLAAQHTAQTHFEKRLELMGRLVECDFDTKVCMRRHFAIIDVGFNCIYLDALNAMADLANYLDQTKPANRYQTKARALAAEMKSKLTTDGVHYYSYDLRTDSLIEVPTWNLFMPLYSGLVEPKVAKQLFEELNDSNTFQSDFGIRTVSRQHASYDADYGFWRGPIWFAPHWFISQGLKRYGFTEKAKQIKQNSLGLIRKSDFREHYDPETGTGYEATEFTWGGLVLLM